MVPPTVGPELTSSPSPLVTPTSGSSFNIPTRLKQGSTTSITSTRTASVVSDQTTSMNASRSASSTSIPFSDGSVDPVMVEGLCHTNSRLNAKRYKSLAFAKVLLEILMALQVPTWCTKNGETMNPEQVRIFKVSGSLTNAVFFVSYPSIPSVETVLLRIYGPSSSNLISRPRELNILHVLSSRYGIGPRIYGTFETGRIEEYFDALALTAAQLRDPTISAWIGARMAELHGVDIEAVENTTPVTRGENVGWEIAARKNFREWLQPARDVIQLPSVNADYKKALDFERFVKEWEHYMAWLSTWERVHGASKRVFAHNDAQYGNLLRLKDVKKGTPDHRQIIVVDFEYASPNSAAFDIANHFHEWTADYHGSRPHVLDPSRYPTEKERNNFYRAYLTHACEPIATGVSTKATTGDLSGLSVLEAHKVSGEDCRRIETQVRAWSPASHAMWAVWGIIQAREDLELAAQGENNALEEPEFDYLGYAKCRVEGFRREIAALDL